MFDLSETISLPVNPIPFLERVLKSLSKAYGSITTPLPRTLLILFSNLMPWGKIAN